MREPQQTGCAEKGIMSTFHITGGDSKGSKTSRKPQRRHGLPALPFALAAHSVLPARFDLYRTLPLAYLLTVLGLAGCGGGRGNTSGISQYVAHFREFPVPVGSNDPTATIPGSWPDDLRGDDQGNIWFAEHHSNEVGRMSPTGTYTGFAVPTPNSEMDGIAVDSAHGRVWVTETAGNKVVRIEMATGQVTEIPVPTPHADPGDLAVAPDGTVWFTEGYEGGMGTGRLARIDPAANQITEIALPGPRNGLDGITLDAFGAVWFVEINDNRIGRYASGQFREFALPRPGVLPTNLAVDTQGRVWVTEQVGNAIAILNPVNNSWQELSLPTPNALPSGITIDRSGNVWFTEFQASKIGLVLAGTTTVLDFAIPTPNSGPEDVFAAANSTVYFTEQYANKIGQITVSRQPLSR